ncbi:hypothetical protein CRG98_041299 [Punica granatum]|uniref:Uncharacterized protein n=1 Tax=Punica granatum TaxID=22663 RepID=A0A2I0I2T7_PUNGR|nr:hypothetical protein CRG98_041299 [Punica granatum]
MGQHTRQGCKRHERGGPTNLRCRKVSSHGLAYLARLQEARAKLLSELAMQKSKPARIRQGRKRHEGGASGNLRCRKVSFHGLADRARLQDARGRWLDELSVPEIKFAQTGQGCKRHQRGGSESLRCRKVRLHRLAYPERWQEALARWLGDLAMQESKLARESNLARVSRPDKVATGTSKVARRTCVAGKKEKSQGLADSRRLQEARATWLGEPKVQENLARLQEARRRCLGELAVQESKLVRVSRPSKTRRGCKRHERGGSANLLCRKVGSHGLANSTRLQHARARWLGELAVQESKLERVGRPGKVVRGTKEVAQRTCGARKKVGSHGLANSARLQHARARWLGELAVQESRLARVSKLGKVATCTGEVARRTCCAGKKVGSHGLANSARLQHARARWLGELAVQESKLAWVGRPGKVARGTSEESKLERVGRPGKVVRGTKEVAQRTCGAGKYALTVRLASSLVSLATLPGLLTRASSLSCIAKSQEPRARWLDELAMQESKLARISRSGKVGRGMSEVSRRTCGAGKKVNSHGIANPARLQETRASWLGELAMQESKLARISRSGMVARDTREVPQRTCDAGK